MVLGQGAFSGGGAERLRVLEDRLEAGERARGAQHAAQLRDVLELHRVHTAAGLSLSTVPVVALVLRCSESRAAGLLDDALGLAELPGALDALSSGSLTVEQSSVVVAQLTVLPLPERLRVWQRLLLRLRQDLEQGAVLPPARLGELLRRWVVQADPAGAVVRRREAAERRSVSYRRRQDGLADLFLLGMAAPVAQACLARIRDCSAPVGSSDERTADQRRLDAAADLILGRRPLPVQGPGAGAAASSASCCSDSCCSPASCSTSPAVIPNVCGCRVGAQVPCGAQVVVHVPLGAAEGSTADVAELVGHGPLEPDLLQELLLAGPVLRAVHVDADGVPVAVADRAVRPQRDDPLALRDALAVLAASLPSERHPRHPWDHPPARAGEPPPLETPPLGMRPQPHATTASGVGCSAAHPADRPGPYRVRPRLRRSVFVRAPRCEWPGCGVRAERCDVEHDVAHPQGPTCACNLGPMCRRHHQIKQQGWTKQRTAGSAVLFTGPGGRRWLSRAQHEPPWPVRQPLPAAASAPDPFAGLGAAQAERERWLLDPTDPCWDDAEGLELRVRDADPDMGESRDVVGELLSAGARPWSTDLDDPCAWLPPLAETALTGAAEPR